MRTIAQLHADWGEAQRSEATMARFLAEAQPDELDALGLVNLMPEPPRANGEAHEDDQPRHAPSRLHVMSWADILAAPPDPPAVIRPGLPRVGCTVLAGAPKAGKTLLASQIALESRLPTLMVVEEGSHAGVGYRLRRQAAMLAISDPPMSLMYRQRIRLDNPRSVADLRAYIADSPAALVILDPLNRLHGADENKPSQMTPVMDAMAAIAYGLERAVLAIHHLAKPSAERRGDIWDRFRGASSIRSGTDANLILDNGRLVGEMRDGEPLTEYLELNRDTLLFVPGEPKAPTKIDPLALRLFVTDRGQVTADVVVEQFGVSKMTAFAALRDLGCDEFKGPRGKLTFSLTTV